MICAQDTATFTCTLESVVALQWVAEPFITRRGITAQQVSLALSDVGITHRVEFNGVTFHAVLTQSEPVQGSSTHYTLQSTLITTASTSTNGTVIECIEPITGASDSSVLQLRSQCHLQRLIKFIHYILSLPTLHLSLSPSPSLSLSPSPSLFLSTPPLCVCVCACVRACVHACVCVCLN